MANSRPELSSELAGRLADLLRVGRGSVVTNQPDLLPLLPGGKPDECVDRWDRGILWRLARYDKTVYMISDPGEPHGEIFLDRYDSVGKAAAAYASKWWDADASVPRADDEIQVFTPGRASEFLKVTRASGDHDRGWQTLAVPCFSFKGPPTPIELHLASGADSFIWTNRQV